MPKKSIFTRKQKRFKKVKPKKDKQRPLGLKAPKKSGDAIKSSINEASALSLHVQQLLDGVLAGAPPVLRNYLHRADHEIRDLIKLLTTKLGGTQDPDQITVSASALLEELVEEDPQASEILASILHGDGN